MKLKLKIRYIEKMNPNNKGIYYTIQYKSFFKWKDLTYTFNMGYGTITNYYENEDKIKLLDEILEKKFNTVKKFVTIYEYPEIKVY